MAYLLAALVIAVPLAVLAGCVVLVGAFVWDRLAGAREAE